MTKPINKERYKIIVNLKDKDKKSYREIAKIFHVTHVAIIDVYKRAKEIMASNNGEL